MRSPVAPVEAPPGMESYDPKEREDWVEQDAGPVHVHRHKDDNGRTGKEVIWSEDMETGNSFAEVTTSRV